MRLGHTSLAAIHSLSNKLQISGSTGVHPEIAQLDKRLHAHAQRTAHWRPRVHRVASGQRRAQRRPQPPAA